MVMIFDCGWVLLKVSGTDAPGQRSVLKYSGVMCGSSEHGVMVAIGVTLLVVFVIGFLVLCSYAIVQAGNMCKIARQVITGAALLATF